MSLSGAQLRETPFDTALIPARGNLAGERVVALQVTEGGVRLRFRSAPDQNLPLSSIDASLFEKRRVHLTPLLTLRLTATHLDLFRRQLNLLRLRHSSASSFTACPCCSLLSPATAGPVHFCSECLEMHRDGQPLTRHRGYAYNFCRSGYFQLLGSANGKAARLRSDGSFHSLSASTRPHITRMASHLLWLTLAIALLYLPLPSLIPTLLAFASLILLCSTLTLLLLRGAIRPLFFPPPPERATRHLQRGRLKEAQSLLQRHNLTDHPGHLANLALASHLHNQPARPYLERALALCPSHPALQSLDQSLPTT